MPGAYDDSLSEEETKALQGHLTGGEVPPADEQEGAPDAAPADSESAAPAAAPPAAAPLAPAAGSEPAPTGEIQQTDDEKFASWMEQHKDKSPEELAKLAFQQTQRAASAGFQQRQTQQSLEAVQARLTAAADRVRAVRESTAQRRAQFADKLNSDPDAAAQEMHERMLSAEEQQAEDDERAARTEAAFGLAAAAIPQFDQQAPHVFAFGGEMGYSGDELAQISDGRDLVVLSLARYAGNLIKAGLMDTAGNLKMEMPKSLEATDPRLTAPTPHQTLSSVPARTAGGGKTADQMASDVLSLSDEDFAKLPPKELESLLSQLNG